MKALKQPLHLIGIALGLVGAAMAFWRQDLIGSHFPILLAGGLAFWCAIDLARRLGLEPKGDPAAPHNQQRIR
jgi:hypothetical protein